MKYLISIEFLVNYKGNASQSPPCPTIPTITTVPTVPRGTSRRGRKSCTTAASSTYPWGSSTVLGR
ncbi:hypothetical protein E2C01_041148 [Portunus trituberculatus]|uniref:Uncharacterized protein n=1 Tax=Portunus trituberculatus TaxID=210409 RepID=A0A5B7FLM9_PORTR|nr:hypothetical protein [Portunus trituberculatus]